MMCASLISLNVAGNPSASCCNSPNIDVARGSLGSAGIGDCCWSAGVDVIGDGELSPERLVIDGDKLMLRVGLVQISGLSAVVAVIDDGAAAVRLGEAADVLCGAKTFSGADCEDSGAGAAMCVCD